MTNEKTGHGIVLADKPPGLGSSPLVSRLKYILREKANSNTPPGNQENQQGKKGKPKIRVGHTGTLDRFASGLMILVVGRGTAFADYFLHQDKSYRADFAFGRFTDTHDSQGEITEEREPADTRRFLEDNTSQVESAVVAFQEMRSQTPPVYSALKKDGQRFSDRARAGEIQTPEPRSIRIYSSRILDIDSERGVVRAEIAVSSGTYIRALARDLSETLGFPVHLSDLRRLTIGSYSLDQDCWSPPAEIPAEGEAAGADPVIVPLERALADWPRMQARSEDVARVRNGVRLEFGRLKNPEEPPADVPPAGSEGMDILLTAPDGEILAWAVRDAADGDRIRYKRVFSD